MSDSYLGDTKLRKGITISFILMLVVVSIWTYSRVVAVDDKVVSIVYPKHIIEKIVSVVDDVVPLVEDDVSEDDISFPILHGLVDRRIVRLERLRGLLSG